MIKKNLKALVIAPHPDDEVLGAGGFIRKITEQGGSVDLLIVTGSGEGVHPIWPPKSWKISKSETKRAANILGIDNIFYSNLPAAILDNYPNYKINKSIDFVIKKVDPELLIIPYHHDLHIDHYKVSYASLVASRPYLNVDNKLRKIIAYETLSETNLFPSIINNSFSPDLYVDITETIKFKIEAMKQYESQCQSDLMPRSPKAIESLAHLRGTFIGVSHAEAFITLYEKII